MLFFMFYTASAIEVMKYVLFNEQKAIKRKNEPI